MAITNTNDDNMSTQGAFQNTTMNKVEDTLKTTAGKINADAAVTERKLSQSWKSFLAELKSYFNVAGELETQSAVEDSIRSGISFKGSQLLILIFAIFIASLGLNTNSTPVVIGAMLISPLMGPIIGMGLAIGIEDFTLLKRSARNIGAAVLGSVITSCIYFLISPQYGEASLLLARTSPSIYDVLVGLFGGAAGIVSIAAKNKGQVMPGVAIATSLMPPLCTAGYGLATLQMHFFFGALYLFFINAIFILFASWIGVKLMKFKKTHYQNQRRAKKIQIFVYMIVTITILFSAYLTYGMIRTSYFINVANQFVEQEMIFPNTQVLNHKEFVKNGKRYIDVTLIGDRLPKDSLQLAMMTKLDSVGLGGTILNIKQGFSAEKGGISPEQSAGQFFNIMQNEISQRQETIDSLRAIIGTQQQFSAVSLKLAPEIKVLFPTVKDIALSQMVAASLDDSRTDTINMLLVNAPKGLTAEQRKKLTEYIGVRLNRRHINLTLNPSGFPWPSAAPESTAESKSAK